MADILDIQKLKERVTQWIEVKKSEGLSQAQMGKMTGNGRAYFNNMYKGISGIGFAALEHIMKIDPKLNKYWLFFGEGEMYIKANNVSEITGVYDQNSNSNLNTIELRTLIDELKKQIRIKDDQIKFLQHLIEDKLP